jgi:hypothetical protein
VFGGGRDPAADTRSFTKERDLKRYTNWEKAKVFHKMKAVRRSKPWTMDAKTKNKHCAQEDDFGTIIKVFVSPLRNF